MTPVRVKLSREKGWRMPENTVRVCRPSLWGNPYKVGEVDHLTGEIVKTRADAVRLFKVRIMDNNPCMQVAARALLAGKNLACWCPLVDKHGNYAPCHADVLLMISNV